MNDDNRRCYQLVIVEDELPARQGLTNHFPWKKMGFEVVGAFPDAEEALAYLKACPCHVVMTDIMMGQMNGLELAAAVKALSPRTKIVILSGYSDFTFTRQAIRSQVSEYLTKPIDEAELCDVFARLHEQLDAEADTQEPYTRPGGETLDVVRRSFLRNLLAGQVYSKKELLAYCSLLQISPAVIDYPILAFELTVTVRNGSAGEDMDAWQLDEIRDGLSQSFSSKSGELLYQVLEGRDNTWTVVVLALHDMETERLKRHCREKINAFLARINEKNAYAVAYKMTHSLRRIGEMVSDLGGKEDLPDVNEDALGGRSGEYSKLLLKSKVLIAGMDLQPALFGRMREDIIKTLFRLPFEEARFMVKGLLSMLLQEYQSRSEALLRTAQRLLDAEWMYNTDNFEVLESRLRTSLADLNDYINREKTEDIGAVGRILRYIEENIGSNLSGDVLAERFHLHPSYISRVFKQKTGEKLSEYVERLRLEKSVLLLYEGNYQIQEISQLVGYVSPSYFAAKFRRATGYAPREYYYQILL